MGSKARGPMSYNFTACKKLLASVKEVLTRLNSYSFCYSTDLLPDDSDGRIIRELWWTRQEFPLPISSSRYYSPCSYITWWL
jgi:hypothetical protein